MKYQLQPYQGMQSRYSCPVCNHHKCFVRYIDIQTGQHLAPHVGRCGREDKCGYHLTPRNYFATLPGYKPYQPKRSRYMPGKSPAQPAVNPARSPRPEPKYIINPYWVSATLYNYQDNNFVQYLIKRLGRDITQAAIKRYHIGTHNHWPGACVFWQYDTEGDVRTGKIMLYNKETGKRVKVPFNHITWAHTLAIKEAATAGDDTTFILQQCLFGEHLLSANPAMPVAIVESEKTAIIASALIPDFIWLASGSLQGLNPAKCGVLKGRRVMLFPDVNAYDKWKLKARELHTALPNTAFSVSAVLEDIATDEDRQNGIDIGDVVGW
ncbi:hypothetical protein DIU31_002140 [Mucilaginibacter rubeus]|uniref:Toprim domain-containing protein n=1 Tax=Mucilaginibacter rubeus TaxID=2027860 RepID=A0AAE6MGP2_9SPHI|nr:MULTISPECIES: DUF6371 domain-containing protein [Mucilaginibacter]QEM02377.1 hypothetical protein DIU31_002140 [Mucilaginibacter rubeus]QEM15002.1 hypothetical protein DIU38_002165 [Mucilaginibacter gossypii]QTE42281.1 hypothetical protein J3L19_25635 [Mucilaginibacter rubeus]QTE48882.1 hypothetical protein J3L21_25605 [Mucilaginibacter rubeus]QTE53980.1 hypothetical protein J3L23_17230 [Mucilaginibacter rubeus]